MAGGGKETPRQRMIGMMYLVLTALLALQVQNEVLEKFYFIDDSLQSAKSIAQGTNDKIIKSMQDQAAETGNNPKDIAIIKKAQDVKARTNEMLDYIAEVRAAVIEVGGEKDPETGRYAKDKDYDDVNRIMLGEGTSKDGFAWTLQDKMNAFAQDVVKIDPDLKDDVPEKLAPERTEIPRYAGPKYENMEWEHINFQNTPMIAALAVLSQLENDVVKVESKAIDELRTKIGEFQIKFDKVQAMASAESNTVAAGTKYKAKMFISATSTSLAPKMTSTAGGVRVDGEGVGTLEFTASGGSTEGQKKTWKGSITIKNAAGEDTTLTVQQEYTVVTPVIEVESGTVNSLYIKCGNDLKVKVPALGVEYNPSFSATGGQVLNGSGGKGSIIIVPTSKNIALTVSSGGNRIGVKKFTGKLVPKPTIVPKGLNLTQGGRMPRGINLQAVPDASFAEQLPKDARYRVSRAKVTLARGPRPIGTASGGASINVSSLASKARPGDRLIIEVEAVQRLNFKGQVETVGGMPKVPIVYAITQ